MLNYWLQIEGICVIKFHDLFELKYNFGLAVRGGSV